MSSAIAVAVQRGNALTLDRVRLMNRLAGLVPTSAQRDAQARREARLVPPVEDAPIAVQDPQVDAANSDFFGADGPAFFDGYDADLDSDGFDLAMDAAAVQVAARVRLVV